MTERTDTERLDWIAETNPEFSDGYINILLGPMAASELGLKAIGGYYIAEGETCRECIDNAMSGKLDLIE